jgi:ABC-type glycerol-3-phosphate transport system permease component
VERSSRYVQLLAHLVLAATAVFVLFPYAWMLVTSIKPIADVIAWPIRWLPSAVTLDNYAAILGDSRFLRSLINSAVVSIVVTTLSLALAVPAAYGLTRLVEHGGRPALIGILASQFFPPMVFFVPFYIILQAVGLLNTLPGLVFAYLSVTLPICTWMVATSLRDIPVEIEEAARIDGCGDFRILFEIVLPIATPGIVTAICSCCRGRRHLRPAVHDDGARPDRAGPVFYLLGQHQIDYARLMAAGAAVHPHRAFAIIQRFYAVG